MLPPSGCRAFCPMMTRIVVALCAALLCLSATSVHAAVHADFNGDGILDSISLPQHRHGAIVVQISGAAPSVLPMVDTVVSIAAIDFDHDGNLDLGALTKHRRLLIWLNRGDGRFAPVHRQRAPTRFAQSHPSTAKDTGEPDPSAAPIPPSPAVGLFCPSRWRPTAPANTAPLCSTSFSPTSVDYDRSRRGRAPPSANPASQAALIVH